MKKVLLMAFCGVVLLLVMAHDNLLMSRLRWLESPQVHKVQKGESLSRLARRHYGNTDYWRELALINRAPNPDHIEPDEEILLPAANVIQDLRKARTISSVNSLVDGQLMAAKSSPSNDTYSKAEPSVVTTDKPQALPVAGVDSPPAGSAVPASQESTQPQPEPSQPREQSSGGLSWFWLILGLVLIGGVIAFVMYRRRQEELAKEQDEEKDNSIFRRREADQNKSKEDDKRQNFPHDRRSVILRKNAEAENRA